MRWNDGRRLLAMAAFGAVIGPVALAWGLQRTSSASASLLLALEAVFTAVPAWVWYRESMDKRVWVAVLLLVAGGIVLVLEQSVAGRTQMLGMFAVGVVTAAWGIDNTLSRSAALVQRARARFLLLRLLLGHWQHSSWASALSVCCLH